MPAAKPLIGTVLLTSGGKFKARYKHQLAFHTPGHTFGDKAAAIRWLNAEKVLIDSGQWTPPAERRTKADETTTFGEFAEEWIETRTTRRGHPLGDRTADEYRSYLRGRLAPITGMPLGQITEETMRQWWNANADKLVARRAAYAFAKSVFETARKRKRISENPCQVENAARRVKVVPKQTRSLLVTGLQPADVDDLVAAMEREEHRMLILGIAYCTWRPGEAAWLRRRDISPGVDADGVPRWTWTIQDQTKTDSSIRRGLFPPHLVPVMQAHLERWTEPGPDGLVFPGLTEPKVVGTSPKLRTGLTPSGRPRKPHPRRPTGFAAARIAIGRPTLRLYDLRHWSRRIWTLAGLDYASVEMLMGHEIDEVPGTYAHLDLEHVWPHAIRVSELAGWTRPGAVSASGLDARLLGAMSDAQLAAVVGAMSAEQLAVVVPTLPPEVLVRVLRVEPEK